MPSAAPVICTGRRVLVTGAGPIGLATALFARIAGAEVTLMDRDTGRLALAAAATGLDRSLVRHSLAGCGGAGGIGRGRV